MVRVLPEEDEASGFFVAYFEREDTPEEQPASEQDHSITDHQGADRGKATATKRPLDDKVEEGNEQKRQKTLTDAQRLRKKNKKKRQKARRKEGRAADGGAD